MSGGVDYAFSPRYRVNATYRYIRGEGLLRGAQPERARQRCSAVSAVRQRDSGRGRRAIAPARVELRRPDELSAGAGTDRARAGISDGSISSATTRSRTNENNSDGAVQRACDRRSRISSGATPTAHAKHRFNGGFLSQAFRDLAMQVNVNGNLGNDVRHADRRRRQRRFDLQRSASRHRAKHAADGPTWTLNMFTGYSFTFGPSHPAAARHSVRARRRRDADGDDRHAPRSGTVSHVAECVCEQPDEPHELHGLQRRVDVAVLRQADDGAGGAAHSGEHEPAVLIGKRSHDRLSLLISCYVFLI